MIKTIILSLLIIPLSILAQDKDSPILKFKYQKLNELIEKNVNSYSLKDSIIVCLKDNKIKKNLALPEDELYLTFDVEKFNEVQRDILDGYFNLYDGSKIKLKEIELEDTLLLKKIHMLIRNNLASYYFKDGRISEINSQYLLHREPEDEIETMHHIIKLLKEKTYYFLNDGKEVYINGYATLYVKTIKLQQMIPPSNVSYEWQGVYFNSKKTLKKCGYFYRGAPIGIHNEYDENGILTKQFNYDNPPSEKFDSQGQRIPSTDILKVKFDYEKFIEMIPGIYWLKDSTVIYVNYGGTDGLNRRIHCVTILPSKSCCSYWYGEYSYDTKKLLKSGNFFAGKYPNANFPIGVHQEYDENEILLKEINYDELFTFKIDDVAQKLKIELNIDIMDSRKIRVYRSTTPNPNWYIKIEGSLERITIDGRTGRLEQYISQETR